MRERLVRWTPLLLVGWWLWGCEAKLDGPSPRLADGSDGRLPAEPAYVCRTRDGTEVTVHGEDLAPVPVGLPGDTRASLPELTLVRQAALDGTTHTGAAQTIRFGAEPGQPNAERVRWDDDTKMRLTLDPEVLVTDGTVTAKGAPPAGLWALEVEGAAGGTDREERALAFVEPPKATAATPGAICLAQGGHAITLSGADFLAVGEAIPHLKIGETDLPVTSLDDCTDVAHPRVAGRTCRTAHLDLAAGGLPDGLLDVQVLNPEPAACPSAEEVKLRVVPAPTVTAVEPSIVCVAEEPREVELQGSDFLKIDGQLPKVTLTDPAGAETSLEVQGASGCEALETQGLAVERCTAVQVRLPVRPAEAPFRPVLTLTNPDPAGCNGATSTGLYLVPPPVVSAVEPPLACTAQEDRAVVVRGEGFLQIDGVLPTASVAGEAVMVGGLAECETLEVERRTVERCAIAEVVLTQGLPEVAPGEFAQPEIAVTNPDPAGCGTTATGPLTVTPPPVVAALDPPLTCPAQGAREIRMTGSGFLSVEGIPMTVAAGPDAVTVGAQALADCTDLPVAGLTVQTCREATITAPEDLPVGLNPVVAANPVPAGCQSTEAVDLRVVPPPTITAADPPVACAAEGPRNIVLRGTDFLDIDGRLPSVTMTLTGGQPLELEVRGLQGNCEDLPTAGLAVRRCDALEVVVPQGDLPAPDRPALTVMNPTPGDCTGTTAEVLTLVPAPTLADASPALVCTAQGERALTLLGTGFLRLDAALPAVTVDGAPIPVDGLEACEPLAVAGMEAEICTAARVRLPAGLPEVIGELAFLQPSIDLTNPDPAGCGARLDARLTVVPRPAPASVSPPLICLSEADRTLVIDGTGFVRTPEDLPTVTLGDAPATVQSLDRCQPLPDALGEVCATLTIDVAAGALEPGPAALLVTNPPAADCASDGALTVEIVPAPSIAAVDPPVVCPEEVPRQITLRGADFLRIDGQLPVVTATDAAGATRDLTVLDAGGCEPVVVAGLGAERCASVTVELPIEDVVVAYRPTLTVRNPDPAGCGAERSTGLLLVPEPSVDAGQPLFLCRGARSDLVVTGEDFLEVDGVAPTVLLDGQPSASVEAFDCEEIATAAADGADVRRCTALRVEADPAALGADVSVTVRHPEPVGGQVDGQQSVVVVEPPRIDTVEPGLICTEDGERTFVVGGANFLTIEGRVPAVRVGGVDARVAATDDCTPGGAGGVNWQSCNLLTVAVAQDALAPEAAPTARDLQIVGPSPAACEGEAPGAVVVPPPLTVSDFAPKRACLAAGPRRLHFDGTGFLNVDGVRPDLRAVAGTFPSDGLDQCAPFQGGLAGLAVEACLGLSITLPQDALPFGDQALTIVNPGAGTCEEPAAEPLYVIPMPEVDSVVPDEVCQEGLRRLTVSGRHFIPESAVTLGEVAAQAVEFVNENTLIAVFNQELEPGLYGLSVDNGDGCLDTLPDAVRVHPTPIVFFVDPPVVYNGITLQVTVYTSGLDAAPSVVEILAPDGNAREVPFALRDPARPNKILATLPAGLVPGSWGVRVTSRIGCIGSVPGALTVTDDLRLDLATVDPAHASPTRPTAVTLTAANPPGNGRVGFQSTPRAYLNPHDAGEGVLATAMRAVVFVDASRATAVVPPDLTPGVYDLIVVNPDATVGLLESAVTVTEGEPPVVTAVEPASLDANAVQRARVLGEHFTPAGVTLALDCQEPGVGRVRLPAQVEAGSATATAVTGLFPADQLSAGTICVVELTNADGAVFRYSAISIKNPAQNLNDWAATADLVEARRAPGLVAGRPTATSRFLYAIGGDAGASPSARTSVEANTVDVFGGLASWSLQRHALPAPRTQAGAARVGRTVFLVGGHDGDGASDAVFAAEILDPLAGPEITDVDLALDRDAPDGLPAGLWHYRVAAVFPEDDPGNPGGESLPGEVLVAQMPAIPGLRVQLTWAAVDGASGYRLYRTPRPGAPVDDVQLLAAIDGGATITYIDAGAANADASTPLPPGSLGVWRLAGALTVPRDAAGVVATAAPAADGPGVFYLYAFGGRDDAGAPLASYDYARVTLDATGRGSLGAFQRGAQSLRTARADLAAATMTNADFAAITAGESWVFIGPGRTANGFSRDVDAGQVGPGGGLVAVVATDGVSSDLAGYGFGAAHGNLFAFGGRSAAPSDAGISAELCLDAGTPGCAGAPGEPPDIRNWNNLGVRLTAPRAFPGSTQESAFFFLVGGAGANGALRSTERTVQ